MLELGVIAFYITFFIVMLFYRDWYVWVLVEEIFWLAFGCAMTLITLFSMHHINQSSKSLENMNICTNGRIMTVYACVSAFYCLLSISVISLSVFVYTKVD